MRGDDDEAAIMMPATAAPADDAGTLPAGTAPGGGDWLRGVLATLRARAWFALASAAIMLVAATIWLRSTEYDYTATLRVAPAPTSARESQSLGALTGFASLTGVTLDAIPVTPFRLYVEGIYTREVAARLARDPQLLHGAFPREWDARAQRWQPPSSPGFVATINRLAGAPVRPWSPPDAARLQDWIAGHVSLDQSPKTPTVGLSVATPDPAFGKLFLTRLHATTDDWLRERTLATTRQNLAYLAAKLPTVTLAEHRQALIATLSDQEQRQMMARNPAAYAAEPFGPVTASPRPTSPHQLPVLLLALFGGAAGGLALALIVPRRRGAA